MHLKRSLKLSTSMTAVGGEADGVINQFSSLKASLEAGIADISAYVNADSTSNSTDENPYLFWEWLAGRYPEYSFSVVFWNPDTSVYNSPTVISTGTGPYSCVLWNAAISGSTVMTLMSDKYQTAFGDHAPFDLIFLNHGHNVSNTEELRRGKFYSGIELMKQRSPGAAFVIAKQNPQQDSGNALSAALAEEIAGKYGDTLIDVYGAYISGGNPAEWYTDDVHPNAFAQENVILPLYKAAFNAARPGPSKINGARLNIPAVNLLSVDSGGVDQGYGHFANYTGPSGAPPGWAIAGPAGLTVTKDTTTFDSELGDTYSVKLVGDGAGASQRINASVSAASLAAVKANGYGTLAVRMYVPGGQDANVGRFTIFCGSGPSYTSDAIATGGWVWAIIAKFAVPSGATSIQIRLTANSSAVAGTVYLGRAILVAGDVPYGDQTAPSP